MASGTTNVMMLGTERSDYGNHQPQIDETTLSQEDDVATTGHGIAIHLGLDIGDSLSIGLQPGNIYFDIKMTNTVRNFSITATQVRRKSLLANDGIFRHLKEVLGSDDIPITCGCNENVCTRSGILHSRNLKAGHGSLKSIDGVDLGD